MNTESLTMPATVADPNRSLDLEQISPATIAHHTVYEKTPNLHQSHICQWGAQPYLVGPLSRLVGKPPLSPWMSTNVLPLTQVGNNTNSAISLTEIFDRVFSDVCNSLGFEVQKQKKRGSGNNRVYRNLKGGSYGNKILYKNLDLTQDFPNKISFHFLWVKMLPKNLPKIFRWPEMCPLDKILAQDFQMAAFTKILGWRDISVVPLLSTENCKTLFHTACMAVTAMQR